MMTIRTITQEAQLSAKVGPYNLNSVVHGDCQELIQALPDESIDVLARIIRGAV